MNTRNLVSVSNETYSDIEDKIENNFFYKVVGNCWYSGTSDYSCLKRSDGSILLLQNFKNINGKSVIINSFVDPILFEHYKGINK